MIYLVRIFFNNQRKYFVMFGGFLVHLTLGEFYSCSHVKIDILNYMKNHSYSGSSVNLSEVIWISGLMVFGYGASFTAGGFLEKQVGPSLTVLIGGWLMSFNVALLYFTLKSYIAIVVLSYGLFSGFGIGLAYGSALGAPLTWFTKNRGLVTGLVVSGFGFSQTIFSYVRGWIMYDCSEKKLKNFLASFFIVGMIYAVLQLIGSMLLKNQPLEEASQHLNTSIQNRRNYVELTHPRRLSLFEENLDMKPHQILREFDFWILWMTFFLNSTCLVFILQQARDYAKAIGVSDGEQDKCVKTVIILCGIFQFCGRIFWGFLMDKKSYKVIMLINMILSSIFIGTLDTIQCIENKTNKKYLYGLWISLINFLLSGIFSIFPTICGRCFGMKHFICNYGMLYTACSVSGLIVSIVISTKSNEVSKEFYTYAFISCSVMSVIAAGFTLLFRGKSIKIFNL